MSALEDAAEKIAKAADFTAGDVCYGVDTDMRSGNPFFDIDIDGVTYCVIVMEAPA